MASDTVSDRRILIDRMWRNPKARERFERYTGLTDEHDLRYHTGFILWAANELDKGLT